MQVGFSTFPELKTARLRLRQLSDQDEMAIFYLRTDPRVNKFINREKIKRPEEALQFISRINKDIAERQSLYWAISHTESPDLIGVVCLWNFTEDLRTAELGYELMPAFQKLGFMQEAVSGVLHYGFEQILLDRIEAFTHKKNKNSIKLLKKTGFTMIPARRDAGNASNIIFALNRSSFK